MSSIIGNSFKGLFSFILFIFRGHFLRRERGARFSTAGEARKVFSSANVGVLIDGISRRLSKKDSFEHLAIIAKPGAGKTSSYIVPNILDRANKNSSMIVLDPSGELFQNTSGYLKKKGYKIKVLSPDNVSQSCKFNPFSGLDASNLKEIEQVCASIILSKYGGDSEGVWNDGAISLVEIFAKCLVFSNPSKLNLVNINYLLQMFGSDGKTLDDWVAENSINPNDDKDNSIVNSWLGITSSNEKMLSSYTTIAKTALKQLNNRDIQSLLCEDTLELDKLREEKTILYVIFPSHQQDYYQFIIDVLYDRSFSILMKKLPTSSDLDVYYFLDEFGSSYIDDFQSKINTIRKYRVSLSIVLQTISQLNNKYKRQAESIKGGIGSYLVFSGADHNTATEISDAIGKAQFIERNKYTDIVKSQREHNLLNPDQIRTLRDNEIVFLSKNRFPILMKVKPFFKNSKYSKHSKIPPAKLDSESPEVKNTISL